MKRRLIAIVVAAALAAGGTLVIVTYVQSADERALAGEQTMPVLVVERAVEAGAPAEALGSRVAPSLVPARVRAEHAVADLSTLDGLVAAVDLEPGEQLLSSRFVEPAELENQRPVEVPPGLLEVTVSLAPDRALGGQLQPGDTVAFVASFDPFTLGAVEPGELIPTFGTDPETENVEEKRQQTPNTSHIILHKLLVTNVQAERLPAPADLASGEAAGVELAPTGNILVTLAATAPQVERVVFTAEHGEAWLAFEPDGAPEVGTAIQHRGTIYE